MNDKLKEFIEANRKAFDNEQPGSSIYSRIQGQHGTKYRRGKFADMLSRRWAAVAAAVIVITSALFILPKPSTKHDSLITEQKKDSPDELIISTDPVYAKQITQFREIIGMQQEELKKLKTDYPELYSQFSGDIISLDSAYRSLKDQLRENPNRETLLEAMLENLQIQSDLLTRQLYIIRQIKQKNNSHEKTRI